MKAIATKTDEAFIHRRMKDHEENRTILEYRRQYWAETSDGGFVGCDNRTGDCFTELFRTKEALNEWLNHP